MLTGKYTSAADLEPKDERLKRAESHFTGPQLVRNLAIVGLCRDIAAAYGPTSDHRPGCAAMD